MRFTVKEYSLVCFNRKTVHYQNFSLPVKSPLRLSCLLVLNWVIFCVNSLLKIGRIWGEAGKRVWTGGNIYLLESWWSHFDFCEWNQPRK